MFTTRRGKSVIKQNTAGMVAPCGCFRLYLSFPLAHAIRGAMLMAAMKARLPLLALLLTCLVSWTALAETEKRQSAPLDGAPLTFRTLDDNTQQVNPDEIWRIRSAATSESRPARS